MLTPFSLIPPAPHPAHHRTVDWPLEPIATDLQALLDPIFTFRGHREPWEHVWILDPQLPDDALEEAIRYKQDPRVSMFVSEVGRMHMAYRLPLPRNEEATTLYRRGWLLQNPGADPDDLGWIAGPAVVFSRRVWY